MRLLVLGQVGSVAISADDWSRPAWMRASALNTFWAAFTRMLAMLTDRASTGTASMLRDLPRGGATEHGHIIGDMLCCAREAGLDALLPRVSQAHMQAYDAARAAGVGV